MSPEPSGVATGIQFSPITAQALSNAFVRLGSLYAQPKLCKAMQNNAMKQVVDWKTSAAEYRAIYASLTKAPS
jgi:starch synthase